MRYLFYAGAFGVLASLVFGVITENYSLAILMSLTSLGAMAFTASFLLFPVPVIILNPLNIKVTHECEKNDKSGPGKGNDDDDDDPPKRDWGNVPGEPFEGG